MGMVAWASWTRRYGGGRGVFVATSKTLARAAGMGEGAYRDAGGVVGGGEVADLAGGAGVGTGDGVLAVSAL